MHCTRTILLLTLIIPGLYSQESGSGKATVLVIRDARIRVAAGRVIPKGMIRIEGGRIVDLGTSVAIPEGARILEARGRTLAPAWIDLRNDGLLDRRSAVSTAWNPAARASEALRAFEPERARRLLRAGVGLTFQGRGGAGAAGLAGSLVMPTTASPRPRVVAPVGGVEYQLGGSRRSSRSPGIPRRFPRRAEAGNDLTIVDHGDHYHVIAEGGEAALHCERGDQRPEPRDGAAPESRLKLVPHDGHYHLLGGPEVTPPPAEGFWGDNELAVLPVREDVAEHAAEESVIVSGDHQHVVDPRRGVPITCMHCMQLAPPDPGALATAVHRHEAELKKWAVAVPRPSAASLTTRAVRIRGLTAAFSKAKRYRKSLEKYEKDLAGFEKKLAEWKKKGGKTEAAGKSSAKAPAKARGAGRRPRLRDLPPEIRKLPLRQRLAYLKKLRSQSSSSGSAKQGKPASGRPVPPKKPVRDPASGALLSVIDGKLTLRVEAHWKQDLLRALDFAKQQKVALVLVGASEAWKILDEIKAAGAMVVLGAPMNLSWERLERIDQRPDLAARLQARGIPFGFMTAGVAGFGFDSLPLVASLHVAAGLSEEAALEALGAGAARVLGVQDRFGTLEVGREACIQILSGPPLDPATRVEGVVLGQEVIELR